MNNTIRYAAIVAAFAAAAVAFTEGATWGGILAALAGILGGAAILISRKNEQ